MPSVPGRTAIHSSAEAAVGRAAARPGSACRAVPCGPGGTRRTRASCAPASSTLPGARRRERARSPSIAGRRRVSRAPPARGRGRGTPPPRLGRATRRSASRTRRGTAAATRTPIPPMPPRSEHERLRAPLVPQGARGVRRPLRARAPRTPLEGAGESRAARPVAAARKPGRGGRGPAAPPALRAEPSRVDGVQRVAFQLDGSLADLPHAHAASARAEGAHGEDEPLRPPRWVDRAFGGAEDAAQKFGRRDAEGGPGRGTDGEAEKPAPLDPLRVGPTSGARWSLSSVARRASRRHALSSVARDAVVHHEASHADRGRGAFRDGAVAGAAVELRGDHVAAVGVENMSRLPEQRLPLQSGAFFQHLARASSPPRSSPAARGGSRRTARRPAGPRTLPSRP